MALLFQRFLRSTVVFAFLYASVCFAQFSSGVQGNVLDTSGAALGDATVTLQNLGTNVTQTAHSDSSGVYRFVLLAPGNYSVTAAAQGFSKTKTDFTLDAAENRDVTLRLAVGEVSSSVVVTEAAPLIDTSETRNQYTIDQQALETLPTANRNADALLGITPGVTGGLNAQGNLNFAPENFLDYSVNGRGENGNAYIVDGLDVTSNIRPGVVNLTPNADSLGEITVQTNAYGVEYGRGSGAQTIATSKSGTERFHGFASEYYRYQAWAARGEFGPSYTAVPSNAPFHTNNISLGIGGPIWKSRKLFFFFSIQPYHTEGSTYSTVFYEDPAFTSFAQAAQPNSPEVALLTKYPVSKTSFLAVNQTAQQLFPGTCGTPTTDNLPCGTAVIDQGTWTNAASQTAKQYNIRLDKVFDKDRVYANFIRNTYATNVANPRAAFGTTNNFYGASLQGNEIHTFSPSMLNEATFGFNRIEGIQPQQGEFSIPVVNVGGLGQGFGAGFAQGDYIQHSYHWRDVLTKIHGAHSFRFGYDGWTGDDTALFQGPYGQPTFGFNNIIDLINNSPNSETSLSYNPVTGAPQPGNYSYRELTTGIFAQDTWKVSKRLTLTYGIRYDDFGNPRPSGYGTIAAPFHLGSGSSFQEQIANGTVAQQSHSLDHDINWIFSPRAGAAWDVFGNEKWLVHGGFGVYHDAVTLGNIGDLMKGNPPNWVSPTFLRGSASPPVFSIGTGDSYPFGFTYPTFAGGTLNSKGGLVGSNVTIGSVDPNIHSPRTETWSIALDHPLTSTLVASIGYNGSHSSGIQLGGGAQGGNQFGADVNVVENATLQNAYKSAGSYNALPIYLINENRLNTSFGTILYSYNVARANYEAVTASVRGRFRQAFFVASYTRSSALDDENYYTPTPTLDQNRFYGNSPYDYPNRFSLGWNYQLPGISRGGFLVRGATKGWTVSGTTTLQSGSPIFLYTSGNLQFTRDPVTGAPSYLPNSGDYNGDGYNYDLPNVDRTYQIAHTRAAYKSGVFPTCNNKTLSPSTYTGGNFANCGPFSQPTFGTLGNEQVSDQFRNPAFAQSDVTFAKDTVFREGVHLNLKANAFNLFNQVNFNGVDSNGNDGNFGRSTSTHTARYLQLGATLRF